MNPLAEALDAATPNHAPHEAIGMDRRQFLRITAGLVGAGFLGLSLTGCTDEVLADIIDQIANRPVRRDINTLAADDPTIQSYKQAILAMQALPTTDRRNWTRQAEIHQNTCRHRSWLFFPWHRAYLVYFERICRQLSGNPSFGLPYWNWTANPQIPAVFFEAGSPLNHSPRTATATSTASSANVGAAVIDGMLNQPNFLLFGGAAVPQNDTNQFGPAYGLVEQTPHNYVHGFVGGTMGTFMSPLDPIFWTHHNQVEHLWVQWNLTNGNANTDASAWGGSHFNDDFCDENANNVDVTVATLLLMPLFSYRFDTQEA